MKANSGSGRHPHRRSGLKGLAAGAGALATPSLILGGMTKARAQTPG